MPVDRPHGGNTANVVVGVVRNFTARYPEGMTRVILLGDPSRGLGPLAEPECRRILAALDLAERDGRAARVVRPLGRRPDRAWTAAPRTWTGSPASCAAWSSSPRRGGEVNVVVAGINVGAQPYWNAEATMLMHTRGILIMTPEGAMVLTGKQALDYSGGVSAEDNQGIGGYERIMGPNGQAQYLAPRPRRGLPHPARATTNTPTSRPASASRGRRPPPTRATATSAPSRTAASLPDRGRGLLRRHQSRAQETVRDPPRHERRDRSGPPPAGALVRHARRRDRRRLGRPSRRPSGLPPRLRIEARSRGSASSPVDGPDQWTAGTLFPLAAKKVARAINAASDNRPLVVLANLSGFDGSPESMRHWQLEYGAEIGRAVVNFKGPIVFCVISRYHGGAFVVFSSTLNDNMEVAALEGAHASVIGGAPAAAVVFAREVDERTAGTRASWSSKQPIADPATPTKAPCAPSSRRPRRPCAPKSLARWPRSSTASTRRARPRRRLHPPHPRRPASCALT